MKRIKLISLVALIAAMSISLSLTNLLASGADDMVTLTGKFTSITRPDVKFKTNDGIEYLVHIGPPWYWKDKNYSINTEAETEIYGKVKAGTKDIFAYTIKQGDVTIKLADDNGIPYWQGDGWGKKQGNGRGYYGKRACPDCPCRK